MLGVASVSLPRSLGLLRLPLLPLPPPPPAAVAREVVDTSQQLPPSFTSSSSSSSIAGGANSSAAFSSSSALVDASIKSNEEKGEEEAPAPAAAAAVADVVNSSVTERLSIASFDDASYSLDFSAPIITSGASRESTGSYFESATAGGTTVSAATAEVVFADPFSASTSSIALPVIEPVGSHFVTNIATTIASAPTEEVDTVSFGSGSASAMVVGGSSLSVGAGGVIVCVRVRPTVTPTTASSTGDNHPLVLPSSSAAGEVTSEHQFDTAASALQERCISIHAEPSSGEGSAAIGGEIQGQQTVTATAATAAAATTITVLQPTPTAEKEAADAALRSAALPSGSSQAPFSSSSSSSSTPMSSTFTFDRIFSEEAEQKQVYETTAAPILKAVLEGFNGCILAYGQTGSGKTFTINGALTPEEMIAMAAAGGSGSEEGSMHEKAGVLPRLVHGLFTAIESPAMAQVEFTLTASCIEIYKENIRDLLVGLEFNEATAAATTAGATASSSSFLPSASGEIHSVEMEIPPIASKTITTRSRYHDQRRNNVDGEEEEDDEEEDEDEDSDDDDSIAESVGSSHTAGSSISSHFQVEASSSSARSAGASSRRFSNFHGGMSSSSSNSASYYGAGGSGGNHRTSFGAGAGGSNNRRTSLYGMNTIGGGGSGYGGRESLSSSISGASCGSSSSNNKRMSFGTSNGSSGASAANNLALREDTGRGVYVAGAVNACVTNPSQVLQCIAHAAAARSVATTAMNAQSSRSHSVFQLNIKQRRTTGENAGAIIKSTLFIVDLAGSEQVGKTHATGERLKEAQSILYSLHCLGNVINALTDGRSKHIPYRDSKLTRLLQDSLGGNSKTCLIMTVSPDAYNREETLATLRFGLRAKKMVNKPTLNLEMGGVDVINKMKAQEALIEEYQIKLKAQEVQIEELTGKLTTAVTTFSTVLASSPSPSASVSEQYKEELTLALATCETLRADIAASEAALFAAKEMHERDSASALSAHQKELQDTLEREQEQRTALEKSLFDLEETRCALASTQAGFELFQQELLDSRQEAEEAAQEKDEALKAKDEELAALKAALQAQAEEFNELRAADKDAFESSVQIVQRDHEVAVDALRADLAVSIAQLSTARSEFVQQYETAASTSLARISDLESALAAARAEAEMHLESFNSTKDALISTKLQAADLQVALGEARSAGEATTATVNALQKDLEAAEAGVPREKALRLEINAARAAIEGLKKQRGEADKSSRLLVESLQAASQSCAALKNERADAAAEIGKLTAALQGEKDAAEKREQELRALFEAQKETHAAASARFAAAEEAHSVATAVSLERIAALETSLQEAQARFNQAALDSKEEAEKRAEAEAAAALTLQQQHEEKEASLFSQLTQLQRELNEAQALSQSTSVTAAASIAAESAAIEASKDAMVAFFLEKFSSFIPAEASSITSASASSSGMTPLIWSDLLSSTVSSIEAQLGTAADVLKDATATVKQQQDSLERDCADLQRRLQSAEEDASTQRRACEVLNADLLALQATHAVSQTDAEGVRCVLATTQAALDILQKDVQGFREEVAAAKGALATAEVDAKLAMDLKTAVFDAEVQQLRETMASESQKWDQEKEALLSAANKEKDTLLSAANKEKEVLLSAASQEKEVLLSAASQEKEVLLSAASQEKEALLSALNLSAEAALRAAEDAHTLTVTALQQKVQQVEAALYTISSQLEQAVADVKASEVAKEGLIADFEVAKEGLIADFEANLKASKATFELQAATERQKQSTVFEEAAQKLLAAHSSETAKWSQEREALSLSVFNANTALSISHAAHVGELQGKGTEIQHLQASLAQVTASLELSTIHLANAASARAAAEVVAQVQLSEIKSAYEASLDALKHSMAAESAKWCDERQVFVATIADAEAALASAQEAHASLVRASITKSQQLEASLFDANALIQSSKAAEEQVRAQLASKVVLYETALQKLQESTDGDRSAWESEKEALNISILSASAAFATAQEAHAAAILSATTAQTTAQKAHTAAINELQGKLQDAEFTLRATTAQLSLSSAELDAAKAAEAASLLEREALQQALSALRTSLTTAEEAHAAALNTVGSQLTSLQATLEEGEAQLTIARGCLKQRTEEISSMAATIAAQQAQLVAATTTKVRSASTSTPTAAAPPAMTDAAIWELNYSLSTQVQKLTSQLLDAKASVEEALAKCRAQAGELAQLQKGREELLAQSTSDKSFHEVIVDQLRTQVQDFYIEMRAVYELYEAEKEKREEASRCVAKLARKVESLRGEGGAGAPRVNNPFTSPDGGRKVASRILKETAAAQAGMDLDAASLSSTLPQKGGGGVLFLAGEDETEAALPTIQGGSSSSSRERKE